MQIQTLLIFVCWVAIAASPTKVDNGLRKAEYGGTRARPFHFVITSPRYQSQARRISHIQDTIRLLQTQSAKPHTEAIEMNIKAWKKELRTQQIALLHIAQRERARIDGV